MAQLAAFDATVLRSNLPADQEARLRAALDDDPAGDGPILP